VLSEGARDPWSNATSDRVFVKKGRAVRSPWCRPAYHGWVTAPISSTLSSDCSEGMSSHPHSNA
jgi:hypothetical protein